MEYVKIIKGIKETRNRPKTALVLGSGAARGLAHIGVLKALTEHHIPIDIVVGSSMGAMIGGAYAAGLSPGQIEEIACQTNWLKIAQILFPKRLQRDGLLDGKRVQEFLIALLGEQKIENLEIPFASVATDIWTGEEICLNSGSLVKAIRASISFPFLFTPIKIDGRYLSDGGVVNPLPVNIAREMGAEFIIAVNATPPIDRHIHKLNAGRISAPKRILAAASSSSFFTRLMTFFNENGTSKRDTEQFEPPSSIKPRLIRQMFQVGITMENIILNLRLKEYPADIMIKPEVNDYQFFDFNKAKEIITAGEKAVELVIYGHKTFNRKDGNK